MPTRYSYSFRPRKQIQRELMVEICQRLGSVAPLHTFEYVGFGGFEFVDFDLFRRRLGIRQMVSYEKDEDKNRYEFNVPFSEINLCFGPASQHLPFLDQATLRIVWLDYTVRLNHEVLQDAETACARLAPGSLLAVTVNAMPTKPADARRAQLVEDVGEERLPGGIDDSSLAKWGLATVQREILLASVREALARRADGSRFEQVAHFRYADGAQMLTIGGLIVTPGVAPAFDACRFETLAHVSRGDEAVLIDAPALTAREAIHLNRQLPQADDTPLVCPGLEDEEVAGYERFYRWYPPIPAAI